MNRCDGCKIKKYCAAYNKHKKFICKNISEEDRENAMINKFEIHFLLSGS
ncbi:MAG: hypothetical protein ACE5KE_06810 [Methanosarcinales archaeon]